MSKASRERERAREAALGRAKPTTGGDSNLGIGDVELSKATFADIPTGPAKDAVADYMARFPHGFVVRNRDEWGWVTEINGEPMLWSADTSGNIRKHELGGFLA